MAKEKSTANKLKNTLKSSKIVFDFDLILIILIFVGIALEFVEDLRATGSILIYGSLFTLLLLIVPNIILITQKKRLINKLAIERSKEWRPNPEDGKLLEKATNKDNSIINWTLLITAIVAIAFLIWANN